MRRCGVGWWATRLLLLLVMMMMRRLKSVHVMMLMMVMKHRTLAEALVLAQGRGSGEGLAALVAFDLLPAVGVHPLVSAQIRELSVGLQADLALERLHATVYVLVLLQPARRPESLAALETRVRPSTHVCRPDMTLQVARISEHLVAVLAREMLSRAPAGVAVLLRNI